MKNNRIRFIVLGIALLVLFFLALSLFSDDERRFQNVPGTAYSASDNGAKAFYLSVSEYGKRTNLYDTVVFRKYARFTPDDSLSVSLMPNTFLLLDGFEIDAIRNHVRKGNSFLFFIEENKFDDYSEIVKDMKEYIRPLEDSYYREYVFDSEKSGKVYLIPHGDRILNGYMKKNYSYATDSLVFIGEIAEKSRYRTVAINEYYHIGESASGGSDVYGMGVTLLMIQIVITTVIWMVYKGVRFGKVETVFSTIKRNETENVHALGNLYKRVNSPQIVFDVHMEALLGDVARYLGYRQYNAEIKDEMLSDPKLRALGFDKMYELYLRKNVIKMSELKIHIENIEKIRREL